MHELGIVAEIVRIVENIAREQHLTEVETLVLQIGEMSPVILPLPMARCWKAPDWRLKSCRQMGVVRHAARYFMCRRISRAALHAAQRNGSCSADGNS